ncbi:MAG: 4Fe-4S binding protein [Coriobacteriales bacterium]|nr:4Fe-4S binding protein [Coriobacteriales bacterium]
MSVTINLMNCTGCGDCLSECPLELLTLVDSKVFQAEPEECVECGRCADTCEHQTLCVESAHPTAYTHVWSD